MPAQMPEVQQDQELQQDMSPCVAGSNALQVVPTSSQHVSTEAAPAPRAEKDEKKEPPKSAQTEVSSGSTREESVASVADECTTDAESDSESDDAMPERPPVPDDLAEALSGLTPDPCVV